MVHIYNLKILENMELNLKQSTVKKIKDVKDNKKYVEAPTTARSNKVQP
jgi:hypothetical protein